MGLLGAKTEIPGSMRGTRQARAVKDLIRAWPLSQSEWAAH